MGATCCADQPSGGSTQRRTTAMPEMAKEVVLAAHNGDTERLRALLEANPNLVDAVRRAKFALLLGRNETSR